MSPSPTALKALLQTLLTTLHTCTTHIAAIRTLRRLSSHTSNLDALESSLTTSRSSLERSFASWRRAVGSRMELGDEIARATIERAIRELQVGVESRLKELASHSLRNKGTRESPGFGDMRTCLDGIMEGVEGTIDECGKRLEKVAQFQSQHFTFNSPNTAHQNTAHYPPSPQPSSHSSHSHSPSPSPRPSHTEDSTALPNAQLAAYLSHMRNSWIEKALPGRGTCFVNLADEKIVRFERPDGFVRSLLRGNGVGKGRNAYVEDYEESEVGSGWSGSRY